MNNIPKCILFLTLVVYAMPPRPPQEAQRAEIRFYATQRSEQLSIAAASAFNTARGLEFENAP